MVRLILGASGLERAWVNLLTFVRDEMLRDWLCLGDW